MSAVDLMPCVFPLSLGWTVSLEVDQLSVNAHHAGTSHHGFSLPSGVIKLVLTLKVLNFGH